MRFLAIVGLSILAAVAYGILHDQVTARICVEYFTVGHPRLIASDSPAVLGLFWGVAATWWVGLLLGCCLAICARAGEQPKLEARDLIKPLGWLMAAMFCFAALAGLIAYLASCSGVFRLAGHYAAKIPEDRHMAFLICGWAHGASYLAGFLGGLFLCFLTWKRRLLLGKLREDRR